MGRLKQILYMAGADLFHDRLVSACQVIILLAVVCPLLLLFALKHGVATSLTDELANNPETLRIRPVGSYSLGEAFFDAVAARPEAGFLVPTTRSIASQIYLSRPTSEQPRPELFDIQMLPTASGDPLSQGEPLADETGGVSLSAKAARRVGAKQGDDLIGRVERSRNGRPEPAELPLRVLHILPERFHGQATVFVDLSLLMAVERFRDDYAVPAFDWPGTQPWEDMTEFASFRLYARELDEVAPLADFVRSKGVEVRTDADQIAGVQALDRNLDALFLMIGSVACLGLVGALLASMIASVDRKRKSMAVLSLLGFERGWIAIFPIAQAIMIAAFGTVAALALYAVGAWAINLRFAPVLSEGQVAASLEPAHLLIAAGASLTLALLPAALAGWKVARIEPSEALREI